MNPFQSLRDYEQFVYTLQERYADIIHSTLVLSRRGSGTAHLTGEAFSANGYRLRINEILTWESGPLRIRQYAYEVWIGNERLYWYDSQPHPEEATLASTDPHHKHVHPDIKHHRIPAPSLSFSEVNLPFLIGEIVNLPQAVGYSESIAD